MKSAGVFFNKFSRDFDTLYDGKRSSFMQWVDRTFRSDMFLRFEMTFAFLGDLKGKQVLDVGCGSGPYIAESLKRGAEHVIGMDAAPQMLILAKQRVVSLQMADRLTLIEGYFPQMAPQQPVDYAIVMGVLDYVEDTVAFVTKLMEIVKVGAVVSFPSVHWFRSPIRQIRYRLRQCPLYLYTPEQIRSILLKAGLTSFEIKKIPGAGMDYVVCLHK